MSTAPSPKSPPVARLVPFWDAETRELWLGEHLVKRFRQPAENQVRILAAFEEENWPKSLSDPLPGWTASTPRSGCGARCAT
jgi:hypothetical protein